MTDRRTPNAEPRVGHGVVGSGNARLGRVDAVFADYLLVRTAGLLPIDLYVPRSAVTVRDDVIHVEADASEAYARWHRPLRRVDHD